MNSSHALALIPLEMLLLLFLQNLTLKHAVLSPDFSPYLNLLWPLEELPRALSTLLH